MKTYFIGLFILICGLICSCQTKDKGYTSTATEPTDSISTSLHTETLPMTQDSDTSTLLPVSTKDWGAEEIRDSISRFFMADQSTLPAHLQLIHKNMSALRNTNDYVFLTLITTAAEHIEAFKKYVFDSPLIKIDGGPGKSPKGILLQDSSLFQMRVTPNIYPSSIKQIEISITNHTNQEAMAGEDQFIEYFDGTEWIGLPQNDLVISIGYPIAPGETRDGFIVRLVPELQKNNPGLYRVYKGINVGRAKDLIGYIITATFYLSDNPKE